MEILKLLRQASFKKSYAQLDAVEFDDNAKLIFMGCSNVGKSSLLNALCGQRRLAYTSKSPGATKLINVFDLDEGQVQLIDLPGYGYAKISASEQRRIEHLLSGYLSNMRGVKRLMWLIDGRIGLRKSDLSVLTLINQIDCDKLVLLTKSDTLSNNKKQKLFNMHQQQFKDNGLTLPMLWSSSKSEIGMQPLFEYLVDVFTD